VGGEEGLVSMKLLHGIKNPTYFWGVETRGFAYGKTVIMDPGTDKSLLGVIDSGTTLLIIPTVMFDNFIHEMASKFHKDKDVDMVCVRQIDTGKLDHCYFNNTRCKDMFKVHGSKFEDISIVFGNFWFSISPETYFRDGNNHVDATNNTVPCCSLAIRRHKDDYEITRKMRFLVGNTFLKNFYSVYDYDMQEVRLGVNIHSKGKAKIRRYKDGESWSRDKGYSYIETYYKNHLRSLNTDWLRRVAVDLEVEPKVGNLNGDLPHESENFKVDMMKTIDTDWKPNEE
jgi:Eukaryotic aspartyl protease